MGKYFNWEKKLFAKFKKNPFKYSLATIGLVLIVFGSTNYFRIRRLSFNGTPALAVSSTEELDIPSEVIIPSVNINLKVDPGNIMDGVWQVSRDNATFLTTSAAPESLGNTVIYGHNKKSIFGNLPYLAEGQKITIKTKSGKIYNYIVDKKYFVGPDRIDLVSPTNTTELTIYTCWGLFDTQRAVIKAKPI